MEFDAWTQEACPNRHGDSAPTQPTAGDLALLYSPSGPIAGVGAPTRGVRPTAGDLALLYSPSGPIAGVGAPPRVELGAAKGIL